jgi:AraC-like DNA-binding protein
MQDRLDDMARRVMRHTDGIARETPVPRLAIGTSRQPTALASGVYRPMACLILQGAKQVMIGDQLLRYDPACCFIASLELPATGRVLEASPACPFVAISLYLDHGALADLLPLMPEPDDAARAAFGVMPVTPELLVAWDQLLALLDAPQDVAVLAPLREREVLYRLLAGPQGAMLRQIVRADSALSQVRRAIDWIHAHYDEKVRVDDLAAMAGMSLPSFHRHFKAATAMSPLQFHKTVRLQAARRLLSLSADASRAAFTVGYESASQFSREYTRLFGTPPSRDAARLRAGDVERPVI